MMKKTVFRILSLSLVISFALSTLVYAQETQQNDNDTGAMPAENSAPKSAPDESLDGAPVKNPLEDLSKEDIVERLTTLLNYHLDIAGNIAGIQHVESEILGEKTITYNGVPLENLDKGTLITILQQVNQLLNQKNLQNLQRQLKNLKQIDKINRTDRMLKDQRNLQQIQNFNRQQKQLRNLNKKY